MVSEAECYKEEDDRQKERIQARNSLESSVFQYKQAVDSAGEKLSSDDKETVNKKSNEVLQWLDNQCFG